MSGTVISTKMEKTIIVKIENKFRHPLYRKVITRHKKYKVHNTDKTVKEGDVVLIKETTPISKEKHFMVVSKVESK